MNTKMDLVAFEFSLCPPKPYFFEKRPKKKKLSRHSWGLYWVTSWVAPLLHHLFRHRLQAVHVPWASCGTGPRLCSTLSRDWWRSDFRQPSLVSQEIIQYIDRWAECDMTQSQAAEFLVLRSPYQMKAPVVLVLAGYTDGCWIFSPSAGAVAQQQRGKNWLVWFVIYLLVSGNAPENVNYQYHRCMMSSSLVWP